MEKKIALLEAHQKEIHDALVAMEGHALRLYQVTPWPSNVHSDCVAESMGEAATYISHGVWFRTALEHGVSGAQEESPMLDPDARAREGLYERAQQLSATLVRMGGQLKEAIEGANAAASASLGDPAQPTGKLVRILNNQLQALTNLDARADELDARVRSLAPSVPPRAS